jgi:molybdopterin-binding protein
VSVIHGSLKSLKIKVPWASLQSKPVRVAIDGILLQAAPLDVNSLSQEDVKQRTQMDKRAKLVSAEETALAAGAEPESSQATAEKASFVQQLTAKIVDNLEITLTNVHIRYEDTLSRRGTTIAAGLTLDKITLSTTDANWKEMFVSRVEKDKTLAPSTHKLGRMENLTVYWNTRAERLDEMTEQDWETEMMALIFKSQQQNADAPPEAVKAETPKEKQSSMSKFFAPTRKSSVKPTDAVVSNNAARTVSAEEEKEAQTQLMYLIPPPNKLEVRITHTDNAQGSTPKIDLSAEISSLRLDLDKLQYQQLMSVILNFQELEKQKLMSLHRPRQRPTLAPRAWWKYAYRLVSGKHPHFKKTVETILLCCKYRAKYIRLIKTARMRIRNSTPAPTGSVLKEEEAQIAQIEEMLPLQTLIVFRQVAALEVCKEEKLQAEKEKSKGKWLSSSSNGGASASSGSTSSTSMFSRLFGGGSKSKPPALEAQTSPSKTTKSGAASQAPVTPPPSADDDDEQLFEQIRDQLAVKAASTSQILFRLTLRGDLAVTLFSDGLPMSRLELALVLDMEVQGAGGFGLKVSLYDFIVEDLITSRAVLPYIIISQSQAKAILDDTARNRTVSPGALRDQSNAQLVVRFDCSAKDCKLTVTALPIEIIWNEECIQRILSMFVSSIEASSVLSNPMLVNAVSRIAADAAVPPLLVMYLEIHIEAPKIIIPEDAESMSGGCVILDMGILDMSGYIQPNGDLNLVFNLNSVNIGMPEVTADRYKYTITDGASRNAVDRRLYLVNPFNINFVMQTEDKSRADMTMALDVTEISAELDASKIVRILRIVNIITRTITAMFTEEGNDYLTPDQLYTKHNEWGQVVVDNTKIITSSDQPSRPKKRPTDVLVDIVLKSPRISAALQITDYHHVVLSVTSLVTTVVQRPHDVVLGFTVTSINLDDSLRSDSQRSVLGTKLARPAPVASASSADLREHLCSVTVSSLFDKHSPLLETLRVGTDVSVQFSKIYANIDDLALLRLCPLLKDIFAGFEQIRLESEQYAKSKELLEKAAAKRKRDLIVYQGKRNRRVRGTGKAGDVSDSAVVSPESDEKIATSPVSKGLVPTGIHIVCALSSVSLLIMRTHDQVVAANVLKHTVDLQMAYSAEIAGLWADVTISDTSGLKFLLNLHSCSITDRRPSSARFVYKKMLCRSTFASEYSSATAASGAAVHTSDDVSPTEFGALKSIGDKEMRKQAKSFGSLASAQPSSSDDNILSVAVIGGVKGETDVDIKVREITSILTVDSVMDLVDVALKNVDAIMKLTEACVVEAGPAPAAAPSSRPSIHGMPSSDSPSPRSKTKGPQNSNSAVPTAKQSSSLNLSVNVINPRLIILENPAVEDARAIVFRSEIYVSYATETEDTSIMDLQEKLNIALQGTEAFVLVEGLTRGSPQQIVEPTAISGLFSRRMEGPILLHCKAAVVAQDIIAKLSLNDLQLANKLLKTTKQLPTDNSVATKEANAKKKEQNATTGQSAITNSISMLELNVELGNINLLAINDSNDLYQPVLRFAMDNFSFDARGAPKGGELSGDGALIFGVDYFNNISSTWEPVLEKCRPCVSLQYGFMSGLVVEVVHDRTFQFNVSGAMAKGVNIFLGLLKRIGMDDDMHGAEQHAVVFYNELGIPLEIADHVKGDTLVYLMDDSPTPLPTQSANKYTNRSCTHAATELPKSFNLRVLGEMENDRRPILALPLNISRPQPHYLRPLTTLPTTPKGGLSPMRAPRQSIMDIHNTEPIVEEVFENQRYNALLGKWKATAPGGVLQDPHNFTDSHGQGDKDLKNIQLPGDRWEWVQSEWSVDKHAVIGKEIDADGFEYATSFGAFSASRQRRTQQPFDVVRRRKWVRSRILKSSPKDNASRPLVIFWDVDVDVNGFRHIHIRSPMQLINNLPCPLEIMLYGFTSSQDIGGSVESRLNDSVVLEPIPEGKTFSIPLMYSQASFICFRPCTEANPPLAWSSEFDCRIMSGGRGRSGSSELLKEIKCSNHDPENPQIAFFQTQFIFSDKALMMVCVPFVSIFNHLPCDYLFRCTVANAKQTHNKAGEYGLITAGGSTKLLLFDCKSSLKFQLQVGSYLWSSNVQISHTAKSAHTIDMLSPSDETGGMSISVTSDFTDKSKGYRVLQLHVFCTYMLVDRSGLNVSVRTKRGGPRSVDVSSKVNASGTDPSEGVITASKIVERRSYGAANLSDIKGSWIEGGNHAVLFQADDHNISFGVNKGKCWSESLSLQAMGSSKVQFEVIDSQACTAWQLAFGIVSLPGAFQASQVVTVVPCYTIVNTTGESIHVRQAESNPNTVDIVTIKSMDCRPWHRLDASAGPALQIRSDSTDWSFGCIDISEIGSYTLILPTKDDHPLITVHVEVKFSDPNDLSYVTMVVWRSVKNKHGFHNTAAICIQNDTDLPLTLLQDGIDFKMAGVNPKQFELCIGPGENLPFGWIDPTGSSKVRAVIDTSLVDSIGQQVVLDLAKVGTECTLEMMHYSIELDSVQVIVKAGAGGRIVHVIRKSKWEAEERSLQLRPAEEFPERNNVFVKVSFHSIGVSLIAERPVRRELFGVYVDGIEVQWSEAAHIAPSKVDGPTEPNAGGTGGPASSVDESSHDLTVTVVSPVQSSRSLRGMKTSLSVHVMDLQVDNYSETMIYPVLIHSYHSNERKDAARKKAIQNTNSRFKRKKSTSTASADSEDVVEDPLTFVTFGMVKFVPQGSITATFKYLALRILELKVAVDTSTLQIYLLDLHNDLVGESVEQMLASANPTKWITNFNSRTVVADGTYPIVNVPRAHKYASVQRMYIEEFALHPIKVRLSYSHTPFPRDSSEDIFSTPQYRWVRFIRAIAGVDDFLFKLKSFIVSDVLESTNSLVSRVGHIYLQDIKRHLVEIASQFVGSMRIIGKPVGLYRNIGAGVKDFYYEVIIREIPAICGVVLLICVVYLLLQPYQGLIHSPESFVFGVGRGTGSLFKHIATGMIGSTAAFVESASKGMAKGATMLSGDAEFARQREEKRRLAASGGLVAGMKAGGESLVSGFASGLSGLVTKPFEEGKKTGVTGFAKGLGLGAVGVIVKPVMGVTDGMAAVAHGLSNQMSEVPQVPQIRPPRAFHRSPDDIEDLILVPLSLLDAKAQAHALKAARKENKTDNFIGSVVVAELPVSNDRSSLDVSNSRSSVSGGNGSTHGNDSGRKASVPTGQLVYLTEHYVTLALFNAAFDIVNVEMKLAYENISHCVLQLEFLTVEFVVYKSSSGGGSGGNVLNNTTGPLSVMGCTTIAVNCLDSDAAVELYSLLYRMSNKMGSPSNMVPVDVVQAAARPDPLSDQDSSPNNGRSSSSASSSAANPTALESAFTAVDGYTFGSVNILKFGSFSGGENDVLNKCEERLRTVVRTSHPGEPGFDPTVYYRELDQKVWRLIYEWQLIHTTIRASRCIATLIINRSEHHVQILRTELMEGKNVRVLGGTVDVGGFDHESRTVLSGGGSAIVFAYGFTPNLVDAGHVKVRIFTSAFSGQVSTRKAGTSCTGVGGYDVRYLEKSSTDWWAKFVILVS